jgi:LmeA-like phospholipid-binding
VKALVITLVVLVGLAVAADRVAVHVADSQVAAQVQQQGKLPGEPTVDITGFPFLTQAVSGTYDDVQMSFTADQLGQPAGTSAQVSLHGVHLPLSAVLSRSVSSVPVDRVEGTATLSYALLSQQIGHGTTLTYAGDGLRLSTTVSILGQKVPLTAAGRLRLDGDVLVVDAEQASAAGVNLPSALVTRAGQALDLHYKIPTLPFGMKLTGVRPTPGGVVVDVLGTDTVLSR